MRIIAGQRRGHKIEAPRPSASTRPTSDFVRESLFNILGDLVVDRDIVDLFAGTGALGLEALSRGAHHAIFVERDRESVGLIHRNIATLRYQDRATVRHADAYRWARTFEPQADRSLVVFLDPPYRECQIRARHMNQMLSGLVRKMHNGSALALEAGEKLDERILPECAQWDIRRYGSTWIALLVVGGECASSSSARESGDLAAPADVPCCSRAEDAHDD
jgi:16S rRNA (guanine966-N2)-methyltransferase